MSSEPVSLKPLKPIRRFDVFAEVNRLKALGEGRPDNEARGYGIWVAKVVASRRYRPKGEGERPAEPSTRHRKQDVPPQYHVLGDELQTEEVFDHDIVDRMGVDFYQKVFAPAIKHALDEGRKYEEIRDIIRKDWKPGA